MIELHDYSFQNIRSFIDRQNISFVERDKLVQFNGENRNTGGSSGSGKSTALIAIDYLLGLSDIPSTVLQSWLTKEDMVVEGNFTINKVKTHMSRSKKKGFVLKYGEEEFQGKLAEEKLKEIVGIPMDVFKQMIHKKQDQRGFFLNKTAKQMYEFLVEMLDLKFYEAKQLKIAEQIKIYVKQLEDFNRNMDIYEKKVEEYGEMRSRHEKPEPIDVTGLDELLAQSKELGDKLSALETKKHEVLKSLGSPQIPAYESYDDTRLKTIQQNVSDMKDKRTQLNSAINGISRQIIEIEGLRGQMQEKAQLAVNKSKQLQEIINNVCFTCKQHYSGQSAQQTQARLTEEIESLKSDILAIKDKSAQEPELQKRKAEYEKKLLGFNDMISMQEAEITKEKQLQDDHKKKYNDMVEKIDMKAKNQRLEASSKWDKAISEIRTKHTEVSYKANDLQTKKDRYEQDLKKYTDNVNHFDQIIKEAKQTHVDYAKKIEDTDHKLKVAEEAHRLIKTYTIQIFQDTLNIIGDIATEMISSIPNIQNASIHFEGCKETKSGSIKDEVTPIITLNGHDKIPVKAFSGGEKTAIELAVDLAVIDVIESKAGKGANFFILDEPFNGLDSVCKEACLEVLKQYDTNKKIIMVDHSSELKEMVSDVILIVKEGETSFVA